MSDLADLYRAVMDNRTDSTPRLLYAEKLDDEATGTARERICEACSGFGLLDENGRGTSEGTTCEACRGFGGWQPDPLAARAAYIRLSVRYAEEPYWENDERHVENLRREALEIEMGGLMTPAHAKAWFPGSWWKGREPELVRWGRAYAGDPTGRVSSFLFFFTRGFVEQVQIEGDDWIRYADEMLRGNPLRDVLITRAPTRGIGYDERERQYYFDGHPETYPQRDTEDAGRGVPVWLALFRLRWPGVRVEVTPGLPIVGHAVGFGRDGTATQFRMTRDEMFGAVVPLHALPPRLLNVDLDAPPPSDAPG